MGFSAATRNPKTAKATAIKREVGSEVSTEFTEAIDCLFCKHEVGLFALNNKATDFVASGQINLQHGPQEGIT